MTRTDVRTEAAVHDEGRRLGHRGQARDLRKRDRELSAAVARAQEGDEAEGVAADAWFQIARDRAAELGPDFTEVADRRTTADRAFEVFAAERALRLVACLPQGQAEAVLLRVVGGLDGPGAARVLGKRPGAVRSSASCGLKRLAAELGATAGAHAAADSVPPFPCAPGSEPLWPHWRGSPAAVTGTPAAGSAAHPPLRS